MHVQGRGHWTGQAARSDVSPNRRLLLPLPVGAAVDRGGVAEVEAFIRRCVPA